jgi:CRP-like cAMP-binding protein
MVPASKVRQPASELPVSLALATLKTNFVFASLPDDILLPIAQAAHNVTSPRGTVLYQRDMLASSAFIVQKGWIKLYCETLDGAEGVYDIVTSGHLLGEQALFNRHKYPTGAMVVESAELLQIPMPMLDSLLESNHEFAKNMLYLMAHRQRVQDMEIENRTLKTTPQRLGCFLLRLCPADGKGEVVLHLPYDKMVLASRLGMQPETFSRSLQKLKTDIGIMVSGNTVRIPSVEKLRSTACSGCSGVFPCGNIRNIV